MREEYFTLKCLLIGFGRTKNVFRAGFRIRHILTGAYGFPFLFIKIGKAGNLSATLIIIGLRNYRQIISLDNRDTNQMLKYL